MLQEDVLYIRWYQGEVEVLKYLLPASQQENVLKQLHEVPTAGHLGINESLSRAKRAKVYWRGMKESVRRHCMKCYECASRKPTPKGQKAPLKHSTESVFRWKGLQLILQGLFQRLRQGTVI